MRLFCPRQQATDEYLNRLSIGRKKEGTCRFMARDTSTKLVRKDLALRRISANKPCHTKSEPDEHWCKWYHKERLDVPGQMRVNQRRTMADNTHKQNRASGNTEPSCHSNLHTANNWENHRKSVFETLANASFELFAQMIVSVVARIDAVRVC
jgi:hypothetical protein